MTEKEQADEGRGRHIPCAVCLDAGYFCPPNEIEGRTPVALTGRGSRIYACDCRMGLKRPEIPMRNFGRNQCERCYGVGMYGVEFISVNERHEPTMVDGTTRIKNPQTGLFVPTPIKSPLLYRVLVTCACEFGEKIKARNKNNRREGVEI